MGHVDAYIRDTTGKYDLTSLKISYCTSSVVRIDAHLEDRVKLHVQSRQLPAAYLLSMLTRICSIALEILRLRSWISSSICSDVRSCRT
jgi:hypothetical protein